MTHEERTKQEKQLKQGELLIAEMKALLKKAVCVQCKKLSRGG